MGDFIEEEEEDLYSDLPNFKYDETVDKLQAGNKELQSRVELLEDALDKKTKELDGVRSQCETLTKNISSLLKTAQNEIKRKDNKINELNKLVLELKTEVLTLKKRKYDAGKETHDEGPSLKQQKLDNSPSVKSAVSQFFCNPEIIEKSTNVQETDESEVVMPEKKYAPDIKIHTVYSQRMYNKIYNIGNPEPTIKNQIVETKNSNVFLDNKVEVNVNSKLENKNISVPKPKSSKEEYGNEKLNKPTFNSQEKETKVDSIKNSDNASCVRYSTPLFNLFSNESLSIDNEKASLESTAGKIDKKPTGSISGSKHIEINKEVSTHYNGVSPIIDKSSADNIDDQTFKNNKHAPENKPVIISRLNRSSNFPKKTDNFSKGVCIKHNTQDSKVSSVVNKDNVSTMENLKFLKKTDILTDKIHSHSSEKLITSTKENSKNSQFSSSFCLKKSKKSVKSVICPISGEWAKNTEAPSHSDVVEMDVTKKGSPCSKTGKEDLDIMEHLFGSPLKWTDNSVDDGKPVEKLSPPAAAYEDSCSAHIENLKFKETRNNVTEVSETKITELSLTKKFSFTERKCYFQPTEVDNELPKFDIEKKSDISLSKGVLKQSNITTYWPFKKTNNEIPSKNRQVTSPTFSTFVNTESTSEACDVPPSLKSNPNTLEVVNSSSKFLKSPKYTDSVLGQFDDTTQLINALAKDPSKLSPIHTPKKDTKLEDANTKILPESAEHSAVKIMTQIPVDKKIISSDVEEIKLTHKEPTPPVAKKGELPVPESPIANKNPSQSEVVNKKMADNKPPISTVEKKSSVTASVISSVEKKLSFPFSVLSPSNKKVEKKAILLEQPVNILCPRKTPRQISKQSISSKKQNAVRDTNKNNKDETNSIKSPSPLIEKQSKTDSSSTQETDASGHSENLEDDRSNIKNRNVLDKSSSRLETNRSSKSPGNSKRENSKTGSSSSVSEDRKSIPEKNSFRKDRSPIKEKSKHSRSRKENIPRRRDHKSPSVKENSPLKSRTDHRQIRRDLKQEIFKRPIYRRESFKRPNCYFRQSSVERKIAKDLRHSSKNRMFPVKNGSHSEINRSNNYKVSKSTFSSKSPDSKEREPSSYSTRTPLISRSSRISWSSSTSLIVSTKPSTVQSQSEFAATPPPSQMKWVLRPIDFDHSPSNTLKESSIKSVSETSMNTSVSSSKTEPETPVRKFLQTTDSSSTTPERSSPGKAIVIVAERRPIKFGSNN